MANAVRIDAPQAGFITVSREAAISVNLPQTAAMGVYNVPADSIDVTFSDIAVAYRRIAQGLPTTQVSGMVVIRGKIDNPKLIAWAFTLDGHDYYVLRLGTDEKTLIYDLSTGQWAWWASPDSTRWRPNIGMNWRSSGNIPFHYGSNVVVGDDSYGILWVLDPDKGLDDALLSEDEITFSRVATGQMISRDRQFVPIYSVALTASLGDPALVANTVTLSYSDDQGRTYVVADDTKTVISGDYAQGFEWRSLGMIRAPGRLFQIADDGAFKRIDGLDVNFMQG